MPSRSANPIAQYKDVLLPPVSHPRRWRAAGFASSLFGVLIMFLAFRIRTRTSCLTGLPIGLGFVFFGTYAMKMWSRYLVRELRIKARQCVHCSYDLTGNASGVCPECGAKITAANDFPSSLAPAKAVFEYPDRTHQ